MGKKDEVEFDPGNPGMRYVFSKVVTSEKETVMGHVTEVTPEGQADREKVKKGWKMESITPDELKRPEKGKDKYSITSQAPQARVPRSYKLSCGRCVLAPFQWSAPNSITAVIEELGNIQEQMDKKGKRLVPPDSPKSEYEEQPIILKMPPGPTHFAFTFDSIPEAQEYLRKRIRGPKELQEFWEK